ncbi:FAD-dependent oxidoreductase [Falsirhodobacter sp. 20TX0035]|uniref:FAD-dependent oxidoreductase n=1 Tax=Falsirhodobacter sp. 20TX0035 TaxID=3022019 RepID=UPI00232A914B|nr:FAD-dependent oxidoreductase [Falsirhodobacter sp. 20TX0035]MDB6454122.1 FAD-dependent oxidoreductase [Falsirhodobacter sp. 20TX0035]
MRTETLARLRTGETFDLLVIGGGATGCGIAVDAASRGLKVALVERYDFAEGTSSRSTKLVHGGVRYLEAAVKKLDKGQYDLVRHALHERGALLKNAPHLSHPLAMITPVYNWWQVPYLYAGLKLYDMLSGKMNIGHSNILSAKKAKARFPMLKSKGLKACVQYYDGQFVDNRMAVTLAMTAEREGAVVANHVAVTGLIHDAQGRLVGAHVHDVLSDNRFDIHATKVINATGPFADAIRRMDHADAKPILKGSSGVHILLDGSFVPPNQGLLIPQTDDGRVVFILPWQGHALVGTTDTSCEVVDHPTVAEADILYLLDYVKRYFDVDVGRADVKAAWSGIRPLVFNPDAKDTAELARDHVIIEDGSGLVTISGGKWTTYRLMAEEAVDRVVATGGFAGVKPCRTHDMKLLGADGYRPEGAADLARDFGLPQDVAHHLNRSYGDRAPVVASIARDMGLSARLAEGLPYIEAEVIYAIRHEAAQRVADVLCRRMTLTHVDSQAAHGAIGRVADLMEGPAGWDAARKAAEIGHAAERTQVAL